MRSSRFKSNGNVKIGNVQYTEWGGFGIVLPFHATVSSTLEEPR